MRNALIAALITLSIAFGAVFAGGAVSHSSADAMPMDVSMQCVGSDCGAMGGHSTGTMECVAYCIRAAASQASNSSPATGVFLFLTLLLVASTVTFPTEAAHGLFRRFSTRIGRILLRQKLATVVLRN